MIKIAWFEPLLVSVPGIGRGLACRICVARYGLKGEHVAKLPQTHAEFQEHMTMLHSDEPDPPVRLGQAQSSEWPLA